MSDFDLDSIAPERRDPSEKTVKQEDKKLVTKSTVPAAVPTALAPPPAAPVAKAAEPEMPTNQPQLNVPAPATPVATNPINGEFLKTAAMSAGIPALIGAGGAFLGNKLFGNQGQPTAGAPAGPSELDQVKLERERFKLEQDMRRAEREQAVFDQKSAAAQAKAVPAPTAGGPVTPPQPQYPQGAQAQTPAISGYGQTTMNAPTGNPVVESVTPPVAEPVVQKPPTAEELRVRAFEANERRKDELHKAKMEQMELSKAKAAAAGTTKPSTSGGGLSPTDAQLLANVEKGKVIEEIKTKLAPVPPKPAPVATAAPVTPTTTPVSTSAAQTSTPAPVTTKPVVETDKLTKEQKGMKNYLVSQYGNGSEGEAAYKKTIEILGKTPEFEKGQGGGLGPEENKIIKDWRKTNIEGPKVNLTYDMKKVMKGAGGLAILTALPGFAEAAQRKDVGKMSDIFTDFFVLPFAQSRGINEGEEQELAKRRYEGAVGGGRGIAPPSAYLK